MTDVNTETPDGRIREAGCEAVRDALPDIARSARGDAAGAQGPGAASALALLAPHLDACEACSEELAFLRRLDAARPSPPRGMAAVIVARALSEGGTGGREGREVASPDSGVLPFRRQAPAPWWISSSAAAAVIVLAAGLGLVARGGPGGAGPTESQPVLVAMDAELSTGWGDEWMVAGAPYLDAVSDETLAMLAASVEP